jgi:hypothetical protein
MEIFPEYGTGLTDHTKIVEKINEIKRAKFFIKVSGNLYTITLNIWINCQTGFITSHSNIVRFLNPIFKPCMKI